MDYDDDDGRQRKKQKTSQFISFEAEEDDDVDEEDEEELDEADRDFIQSDSVEEVAASHRGAMAEIAHRNRTTNRQQFFDDMEQRYLHMPADDRILGDEDEEEEEEEDQHAAGKQQMNYPTVKDPKLFLVTCKHGKEREAALMLLQRTMDCLGAGEPLLITSVVALDTLKGYIYVESHKELHVKKAVQGIRLLSEYRVKLVPIEEMTSVLTVRPRPLSIEKGSWVRIKSGLYKGDLAQVWFLEPRSSMAVVKMIPRIDMNDIGGEAGKPDSNPDRMRKRRGKPQQRFFNEQEIKQACERVGIMNPFARNQKDERTNEKFLVWQGNKYRDGYIYKGIRYRNLETRDVNPTFDEIQRFTQGLGSSAESVSGAPIKRPVIFKKGDKVLCVSGDLRGISGTIDSVSGDVATILPKPIQGLTEPFNYSVANLQKYFEVGDFVTIIGGINAGESGHVVKVDHNTVVVFSDIQFKEMQVLVQDLQEATEASVPTPNNTAATTAQTSYTLHDLVKIDSQTMGVVIKVDRDVYKVIDNNGLIHTLRLAEMGQKRFVNQRANIRVRDHNNNFVGTNDMIQVVEGEYAGRQAVVKYVFRNFLFCHTRNIIENSGIFVVRARSVEVKGGQSAIEPAPMMRPPSDGGFRGRGGFRGGRGGARGGRALIGKTVRLQRGAYKNMLGVVVGASDAMVRVELHSQMRTVSVNRDFVAEVGSESAAPESTPTNYYAQTPMRRPHTPSHYSAWDGPGGRTPMRGDGFETPLHPGAMTPSHGNETPWNPRNPNTPMHESGSSSSSYGTPFSAWAPASPGAPLLRDRDRERDSFHAADRLSAATPSSIGAPSSGTPASAMYGYGSGATPGSTVTPSMGPMADTPQLYNNPPTPAIGGGHHSHLHHHHMAVATPGPGPLTAATPGLAPSSGMDDMGPTHTPSLGYGVGMTANTPMAPLPMTTPDIVSTPHTPGLNPRTPSYGMSSSAYSAVHAATPSLSSSIGSTALSSGAEAGAGGDIGRSGAGYDTTTTGGVALLPDIEVQILGGPYANQLGVITEVLQNRCVVFMYEVKSAINVELDQVRLVPLHVKDRVKVLKGAHRGACGMVQTFQGQEAAVVLDNKEVILPSKDDIAKLGTR